MFHNPCAHWHQVYYCQKNRNDNVESIHYSPNNVNIFRHKQLLSHLKLENVHSYSSISIRTYFRTSMSAVFRCVSGELLLRMQRTRFQFPSLLFRYLFTCCANGCIPPPPPTNVVCVVHFTVKAQGIFVIFLFAEVVK